MRRFSKILATVLLCAVISASLIFFASAAGGSSSHQLVPEGCESLGYTDFESNGVGDASYASGKGSDSGLKYGWTVNDSFTPTTDAKIQQQTNPEGTEKNKFLSFDKKALSSAAKAAYWEYRVGNWSNNGQNYNNALSLKDFSYVITDFDLACNQYKYTLDGTTYYGTEIPEGATNVTLNYPAGTNFNFIIRSASGQKWVQFYLVTFEGNWYFSADASASPDTDIQLSNDLGAWNHISLVVKTDYDTHTSSMQYAFVNGQYLSGSFTTGAAEAKLSAIDTMRINIPASLVAPEAANGDYNLCLDNITNYAYSADYKSPDHYGIDDFFADDFKTLSTMSCNDFVFNEYYTYVGTPNVPPVTIEKPDGSSRGYFSSGTALREIEDGDYLTTRYSITNFKPNLGITDITIKCIGDVTVSLSPDVAGLYKIQKYKDTYKIKLANENDGIKLLWLDPDGETLKEQILLPHVTPNPSTVGYKSEPDLKTYEIKALDNWKWDIDGDGAVFTESELKSFTVAEMFELKEIYGIDTIEIKPELVVSYLKFVITTPGDDGEELFLPGGSYTSYLDFANFKSTISRAPDNATVKLIKSDDDDGIFKIPVTSNQITSGKEKTLTIDLNGFTLSYYSATAGNGYSRGLFTVPEGATLNLISSKPNGKIFQAHLQGSDTFATAGVVEVASGIETATINFGNPDGSGTFDCNGGTAVAVLGNKTEATNKALENYKKIKINVYGGNFYQNARPSYSMFSVQAPDVEITIDNATIYNATSNIAYGIFVDYPGFYCGSQKIKVTNSSIIARTTDNSADCTIFEVMRTLDAYFENTLIIGNLIQTNGGGNITFGQGVKFASTDSNDVSSVKFADGVNYAANSLDNFTTKITVSYPGMHFKTLTTSKLLLDESDYDYSSGEKSSVIRLSTFTDTLPESVVPVNFYNPGTNEIHTTDYVYVGNTVDPAKHSLAGFAPKALSNGWYDLAYDTWVNVTDGEDATSVTAVADKENKFIATADTPVPAVSANISAEFFDRLGYNFYFVIPEASLGVTFDHTGASDETGFFINGVSVRNNITSSTTQYKFSGYLGADEFESPTVKVQYVVSYDVDKDGTPDNTTLYQEFKFDIFEYFEKASASYACGTDNGKFMIALMQFKLQEYMAAHPDANGADLTVQKCENAIYAHGRNCDCVKVDTNNLTFKPEETAITADSYSSIAGKFIDIVYYVNKDGKVDLVIYTASDSDITAISASLGSASPVDLVKSDVDYNGDDVLEIEYRLSGISVIDSASIISITATTAGGDLTAKYCLAEEIEVNPNSVVAKMLYVIANAD